MPAVAVVVVARASCTRRVTQRCDRGRGWRWWQQRYYSRGGGAGGGGTHDGSVAPVATVATRSQWLPAATATVAVEVAKAVATAAVRFRGAGDAVARSKG